MKFYEKLFIYLTNSWYILFILASLKLWNLAQLYLNKITYYYNLLVALVLIVYYNPFVNTKITPIHRKMVFSSAFFLLVTIGLENLIDDLSSDIKEKREKEKREKEKREKEKNKKNINDYLNIFRNNKNY